jgi:hypothetical protein
MSLRRKLVFLPRSHKLIQLIVATSRTKRGLQWYALLGNAMDRRTGNALYAIHVTSSFVSLFDG